jgi:hypothetical protein
MNTAVLLVVALLAANLPFLSDRLFYIISLPTGKHAGWHLLELVLAYFLVGGISVLLERQMGPTQSQGWEFYAVTGCMFLVFAFPGFTYRHLWRRRPSSHGAAQALETSAL